MKRRWWIVCGGVLLCVMLALWQKCTAWEDRYTSLSWQVLVEVRNEADGFHARQVDGVGHIAMGTAPELCGSMERINTPRIAACRC